MARWRIYLMVVVGLLIMSGTAMAQTADTKGKSSDGVEKKKKTVAVTTELGLSVGAQYNWMNVVPVSQTFTPNITTNVSFGASLHFRLNIGKVFGIQPEVSYAYANLRIKDETHNFSTKARHNLVQMPILLSFRIAMFRINFGPVITLMDNPIYNIVNGEEVKQMTLGRIYPTMTYAAGLSVKFARCMMIDVRYTGQFMDIEHHNEYVFSLATASDGTPMYPAQEFFTRRSAVQVRFGYVF